jgi:hypothetical protein
LILDPKISDELEGLKKVASKTYLIKAPENPPIKNPNPIPQNHAQADQKDITKIPQNRAIETNQHHQKTPQSTIINHLEKYRDYITKEGFTLAFIMFETFRCIFIISDFAENVFN